jgi:hypothetical protein
MRSTGSRSVGRRSTSATCYPAAHAVNIPSRTPVRTCRRRIHRSTSGRCGCRLGPTQRRVSNAEGLPNAKAGVASCCFSIRAVAPDARLPRKRATVLHGPGGSPGQQRRAEPGRSDPWQSTRPLATPLALGDGRYQAHRPFPGRAPARTEAGVRRQAPDGKAAVARGPRGHVRACDRFDERTVKVAGQCSVDRERLPSTATRLVMPVARQPHDPLLGRAGIRRRAFHQHELGHAHLR